MKYLLWFMPLLFLSCTGRSDSTPHNNDTIDKVNEVSSDKKRLLESFTEIPPAIEGCSGLFTEAMVSNSAQYLFVMDLQGRAFLKMHGSLVELTRVEKLINDSTIKESYKASSVIAWIDLKQTERSGDEVWKYKGQLTVEYNGETEVYVIEGEVGC